MRDDMRILIVEDEVKTREGLEMLVKYLRPDAAVSTAECGAKALELSGETYFDLIFTDIKMPGMDGFEMLSRLDRRGRMIVIVSGYSDFSYARQAIRFSVLDYVLKPVSAVKINEVLKMASQKIERLKSGCLYSYLTGYEDLSDESREYYWNKLELLPAYMLACVSRESGKVTGEAMDAGIQKLKTDNRFRTVTTVIREYPYVLISASSQSQAEEGAGLLSEYIGEGAHIRTMGPSCNQEDLILFYRNIARRAREEQSGQAVSETVRLVREFIRQNLETNISLSMLAEVAFVHPAYLSTLFKKETGENLTDYIVECRISRAKELLRNPLYKIYEVAVAVGYTDAKYFSSVFKSATGMTPREWRGQLFPKDPVTDLNE